MGKRKRHHFIPQFYLAGFTDSGKKDGSIWVTNIRNHRSWRTTPVDLRSAKQYVHSNDAR